MAETVRPKGSSAPIPGHRGGVESRSDALDPDACNHPDVIVAQQAEDPIEEANGMGSLPCVAPRCIGANVGALDLGQDSVQMLGGGIGQARKVLVLQGQEIVGEVGKVRGIDEETADGEDGLVVRLGRISECSEIPRFVHETDVQRCPRKSYGHRMVAIGSAAHAGVGNRDFLQESIGRDHPDVKRGGSLNAGNAGSCRRRQGVRLLTIGSSRGG